MRERREVKMVVTPVRGLVRPARIAQSFRMKPDTTDLINEAKALYAAEGQRLTRDDVMDLALWEFIERVRDRARADSVDDNRSDG